MIRTRPPGLEVHRVDAGTATTRCGLRLARAKTDGDTSARLRSSETVISVTDGDHFDCPGCTASVAEFVGRLRSAPADVLLPLVTLLTELRFRLSEVRADGGAGRLCPLCQRVGAAHTDDGPARDCPLHRAGSVLAAIEAPATPAGGQ